MSLLIVHNPMARVTKAEIERLLGVVAPRQHYSIVETDQDRNLSSVVDGALDGVSAVIAVGGDGTVSETASLLLGTDLPLGIIPAGSTNMLAKINRLPSDPERALRLIMGRHRVEKIDAGVAGTRLLLHLGGAGLDARIFKRSNPTLKRKFRWLGYVPAAVQSLGDPAFQGTVTVDGNTVSVRSRFVLIANSGALIHPELPILPTASRTDGVFDVGIFTADTWPAIAKTALDLTMIRWRPSSRIIRMRGQEISVRTEPAVPFEFDGDVIGETPFHLSVKRQAIAMICGD